MAALATTAAILGESVFTPDEPAQNAAPASSEPDPVPEGFTPFHDDKVGFDLSYPSNWQKLDTQDPQVLLLATQGTENSFLVRVADLQVAVGPQELATARQLTDQIVGSNQTVQQLIEPKQIELQGLPGFYYFYKFQDPETKQTGVHSHYFLFKGNKMLTLVFQSIPDTKFRDAAPTFDQITSSFRVTKK